MPYLEVDVPEGYSNIITRNEKRNIDRRMRNKKDFQKLSEYKSKREQYDLVINN